MSTNPVRCVCTHRVSDHDGSGCLADPCPCTLWPREHVHLVSGIDDAEDCPDVLAGGARCSMPQPEEPDDGQWEPLDPDADLSASQAVAYVQDYLAGHGLVTRLSVNLSPTVARALKTLAAADQTSLTEEIRFCIRDRWHRHPAKRNAPRALIDLARQWHDASDHGREGALMYSPMCNCEQMTRRAIALGWLPEHEAARTPAGPDARERAAGMDRDEETDR